MAACVGEVLNTAAREKLALALPALPWIHVARDAPYFITASGKPWTPIGHNSAITWPDLAGGFARKDPDGLAAHLQMLAAHGVTCIRLMLEYCRGEHRYLEQPAGRFKPRMVQYWDDMFRLCEQYGLRILLTPFDTFWMWIRWKHHPYNARNGGPGRKRSQLLLCPQTRAAIKNRLAFATERWSGSGALFAWDLWNEIHPSYAENSAECFGEFIDDIGGFLRDLETRLHGRAHLQTVSVFSPQMALDSRIAETIFRHPALDFANTHFYEEGTIDHPSNTVDPAVATGKLTREALSQVDPRRPFFDSEHGPIHTYKDRHKSLPEAFDEEYFRHMQWAHFASGGAGGGMRWPNRKPHILTAGMHRAQRALADFLPLVDWENFERSNLNVELGGEDYGVRLFGCGDSRQAIVWMLRADCIGPKGMLDCDRDPLRVPLRIPGLRSGNYNITAWDTRTGAATSIFDAASLDGLLCFDAPPVSTDLALAIRYSGTLE
ncbi:MAG: hypothetical protein M3Z36_01180 [Acidobacteriota bacterium]|nr:hypothetical protein [Acidobacteriota bacterium]